MQVGYLQPPYCQSARSFINQYMICSNTARSGTRLTLTVGPTERMSVIKVAKRMSNIIHNQTIPIHCVLFHEDHNILSQAISQKNKCLVKSVLP